MVSGKDTFINVLDTTVSEYLQRQILNSYLTKCKRFGLCIPSKRDKEVASSLTSMFLMYLCYLHVFQYN